VQCLVTSRPLLRKIFLAPPLPSTPRLPSYPSPPHTRPLLVAKRQKMGFLFEMLILLRQRQVGLSSRMGRGYCSPYLSGSPSTLSASQCVSVAFSRPWKVSRISIVHVDLFWRDSVRAFACILVFKWKTVLNERLGLLLWRRLWCTLYSFQRLKMWGPLDELA